MIFVLATNRAVGESLGPSLESSPESRGPSLESSPSHLGIVTRVKSRVTGSESRVESRVASLMYRVMPSHKPYVSSLVESDDYLFKRFNVAGYNHGFYYIATSNGADHYEISSSYRTGQSTHRKLI